LVDHPLVLTYYRVSSNSTFDDILRNSTLTEQTLELWEETPRSGLFTTSPTNVIGFMRIPQGEGKDDPSTGPTSAHTEILFTASRLLASYRTSQKILIQQFTEWLLPHWECCHTRRWTLYHRGYGSRVAQIEYVPLPFFREMFPILINIARGLSYSNIF